MKRFVIERHMAGVGGTDSKGLREAARQSNEVIARLKPAVQWQESYITDDRIYCVYLADDEATIREHARLSGFPASVVSEVRAVIDPSTAG